MKAVNLIPRQQRGGMAQGRSNGAALFVPLLIAGLAVMAVLYGSAHHRIASGHAEAATLSAEAQTAEAQVTKLVPYTSFVALREERVHAVSTLIDARFDWAHALHELGRVLPAGTSLSTVDGSIAAAATTTAATTTATTTGTSTTVTSATPAGSIPSFVLTGCATSQSKVAEALDRLRLIDGVDDVQLQSSTKSGSSSSSSSSSSSGCTGDDPVFTVQVTFDALPSSPTPVGAAPTSSSAAQSSTAATTDTTTSSAAATPTSSAATTPSPATTTGPATTRTSSTATTPSPTTTTTSSTATTPSPATTTTSGTATEPATTGVVR